MRAADEMHDGEVDTLVKKSKLIPKYNQVIDSESAYEMLTAKIEEAVKKSEETKVVKEEKEQPSMIEKVMDNSVVKSVFRTAATTLTRSLLGALGLGGKSKSKKSWF